MQIRSLADLATPPPPTDAKQRAAEKRPAAGERSARAAMATAKRTDQLGELIDDWLAKPGRASTLEIWTSTGADAIDPIEHLARRFGPYALVLTTFSIAESSLRRLKLLRDAGHLTTLEIVADALMLSGRHAASGAALRQTADRWAVCATHAKAYVLWPAGPGRPAWSVTGSANLTHNPRIENIQISDQRDLAAFYRDRTLETIERHAAGNNAAPDDAATTGNPGRPGPHRNRGRAIAGKKPRRIQARA